MGCFGTEPVQESARAHPSPAGKVRHQSLRSILSSNEGPESSGPSSSATASSADYVKRVVESKLGLVTRKTLRARAGLLNTASMSLARAQQRAAMACTSSSSCSSPFIVNNCSLLSSVAQRKQLILLQYFVHGRQVSQEQKLFPLPLPPGYSCKAEEQAGSKASTRANSASDISMAPSSPSSSTPSLFSSSSSLPRSDCSHPPATAGSASKVARCNSLSLRDAAPLIGEEPPVPLPPPANPTRRRAAQDLPQKPAAATATPNHDAPGSPHSHPHYDLSSPPLAASTAAHLRQYSLEEVAAAWDEPGPQLGITVARVAVNFSQRRWKANVQALARLEHPNLCKIVGFAYEKVQLNGPILMETCNAIRGMGTIVYETCAKGSLHSLLKDSCKDHQTTLDWSRRMQIATGAAEGLAFLHEGTSNNQVYYGNFTASCIQVDANFNARLAGFGVPRQTDASAATAADSQGHEKADVQAFGLLLQELFAGTIPKDGLPRHLVGGDANLVADLAARCLSSQPSIRPSMRHVVHSLRATQPPPLGTLKKKKRLSLG